MLVSLRESIAIVGQDLIILTMRMIEMKTVVNITILLLILVKLVAKAVD